MQCNAAGMNLPSPSVRGVRGVQSLGSYEERLIIEQNSGCQRTFVVPRQSRPCPEGEGATVLSLVYPSPSRKSLSWLIQSFKSATRPGGGISIGGGDGGGGSQYKSSRIYLFK
jgi:hypothetical protein